MPRFRPFQDGFSGGELQPTMQRAVNNPIYNRAAKKIENFNVQLQGAVTYRNGQKHHILTKSGGEAFLIQFKFSESEQYVLEFGALYFRVHKFGDLGVPIAVVSASGVVTNITQAAQGVVTSAGHSLINGESVYFESINGMRELNGPSYEVSDVTTNTYKLKDPVTGDYVDTSAMPAYIANAGNTRWNRILEVATPYNAFSNLKALKYAQSGNQMFMVHGDYKPRVLTRVSDTNWTMGTYVPTADPFTTANNYPRAITMYENRILFASTYNNPQTIFATKANDYGDMTVGANAADGFEFTLASTERSDILWMDSNERYLIAGTLSGAQKVYGANEQTAMTPTAITNRKLCETNSNIVRPSMVDGRLIFVERGGRRVRALEFDIARDGYDALDMNIISNHLVKSSITDMVFLDSFPDTIYAVREDGQMIACSVNFRENIYGWYRISSVTGLYKSVSVAENRLWCVVEREINGQSVNVIEVLAPKIDFPVEDDYYTGEDNKAANRETFLDAMFEAQKISNHLDSSKFYDGLHPREILTNSISGTNAAITLSALTGDITVIAGSVSTFEAEDVGREIWGGDGRGRAIITAFTSSTEVEAEVYSDFRSLTYIANGWYLTTDEMWGLQHFEGEEISVYADGGYIGEKLVTNGRINLDEQYSYLIAGKKFTGVIKSLALNLQGASGSQIGKLKSSNKIALCYLNTLGTKFGDKYYSLRDYIFKTPFTDASRVTPLFSGVKEFKPDGSWDRDKEFVIVQDRPYPCELQAVVPYANSSAS